MNNKNAHFVNTYKCWIDISLIPSQQLYEVKFFVFSLWMKNCFSYIFYEQISHLENGELELNPGLSRL